MGAAQVHDAIDGLATVDADSLSDTELDAELVALLRARHRLDAQIARRVERWQSRGVYLSDGSKSSTARLSRDAKLHPAAARRLVARAASAGDLAATMRAWLAGTISTDSVDQLVRAAGGGRGDAFVRDEVRLVGHVEDLSPTQADKVLNYWMYQSDLETNPDGTPPEPEISLSTTVGFAGAVHGRFSLDPIGGAAVNQALHRIETDLRRRDEQSEVRRTLSERRAAALVEMAIRACTPHRKGKRPEPLVVVLAGEATLDHVCELATGTVIRPGLIIPHLSTAHLQTLVFDGADRVITGSHQRHFRGLLKRAIQARDRHCTHPAVCDEPITRCDIDHITPWSQVATTTLDGGRLQCQSHNRDSKLHHRTPAFVLDQARQRRALEQAARDRARTLITSRDGPPDRA